MNEIKKLVLQCVETVFQEQGIEGAISSQTHIYGLKGQLNSLALVRLIVELEEAILNSVGKVVILTDNKVLSAKNSPFRTLETLTTYVIEKIGVGV